MSSSCTGEDPPELFIRNRELVVACVFVILQEVYLLPPFSLSHKIQVLDNFILRLPAAVLGSVVPLLHASAKYCLSNEGLTNTHCWLGHRKWYRCCSWLVQEIPMGRNRIPSPFNKFVPGCADHSYATFIANNRESNNSSLLTLLCHFAIEATQNEINHGEW